MVPTILGGLHKNRTARTISFEVLVSPPSPDSIGRVVGHCSLISKTPSSTGAQVEAFVLAVIKYRQHTYISFKI
jgi:hypothetical protein